MKADFGRIAGDVVDGEDIKADCIVLNVAFGEEEPGRARQHAAFLQ